MPVRTMTGRSPAGGWLVTDTMVRRAGVAAAALAALRDPELADELDALHATRTELADTAARLEDTLYALIGRQPADDQLRPALVGLRRAVHHRRRPARRELADAVITALPLPARELLERYLGLLEEERERRSRVDRRTDASVEVMIDRLRDQLDTPAFRHGLAVASASLAQECERWLREPERRPQRKKVLMLAKYLARAAAKTSPYSTFTSISPAVWADRPAGGPPETGCRIVTELDGAYEGAVRAALVDHPEIADDIAIMVNSSLPAAVRPDSRVPLIGRPPAEPVVEITWTAALAVAVDLVRCYGLQGRRRVVQLLAQRTAQDVDTCNRFVDRLLQLGVLHPVPPVADHDHQPWRTLAGWLDDLGPSAPQPAGKLIAELADELDPALVPDDPAARTSRLQAIRRITAELATELSVGTPAVVHETAIAPVRELPADAEWRAALDDVDVARRWLTLFDASVPVRLILADWYRRTFGAEQSVPFLEFHRRYRSEVGPSGDAELRRMIMNADSPFPVGLDRSEAAGVGELVMLRRRAVGMIEQHRSAVTLSPQDVADRLADAPNWLCAPGSVGCYLQQFRLDGELHLVINAMHLGHGRAGGRLNRLLRSTGQPELDLRRPPEGTAEFGSDFGSSMNRSDHRAELIIDYPFERPHSEGTVVPPTELLVRADPATGLLRLSTTDSTPISPAHLGMSAEFVLPPAARLLQRAFSPTLLVHPSAPPLSTADLAVSGGRPHFPRVSVGRAVVQRERWCIPGEAFPARRPGETDGDHLSRLTETLGTRGIGSRFFLRSWTGDRTAASKSRKPVYVDCASPALVAVMERVAVGARLVVIDEALPDPIETAAANDPYVEEIFVELSDDIEEAGR